MKKDKSHFDAKMRSVNDLMAYIDAPIDIRSKIQDFFEFKFNNKEGISIAEELPVALQTSLVKHRWGELIEKVPFFKGLKDNVVVELCKLMDRHTVAPMDYIMEVGEHHNDLLILSKGTAATPTPDKLLEERKQAKKDAGDEDWILEQIDPDDPEGDEFEIGTF